MKSTTQPRRTVSFRPRMESLEDRTVPSIYTVDRLPDFDMGSGFFGDLRYCVTRAQDGDSIRFSVQGTINLMRGPLPDLTRSISIEGPGPGVLTVRRATGGNYRVFTVAANTTVAISGLTIANGNVPTFSGGGLSNAGTLTISSSTISGNTAREGGGIVNLATGALTILSSSLTINIAMGMSPVSGGGISNAGRLTIVNSTLSGNRATVMAGVSSGGGISNTEAGTLNVVGSTITANAAVALEGTSAGGGLAIGGAVLLRNSIVAGNMGGTGPDLVGTLTSSGFNLIGNTAGGSGFRGRDLLNVNAQLGPLQNNGGPTPTHALLPSSPAIDRGSPKGDPASFDQRGAGFARIVGGRIDIGAFEVQAAGFGPGGTPWAPVPLVEAGQVGERGPAVSGLAVNRRRGAAEQRDLDHDFPGVVDFGLHGQVDAGPLEQPRLQAVLQRGLDQAENFHAGREGESPFLTADS